MGNHPFNVIVILFWVATMSWLFVAKILPPLRVGEPPQQQQALLAEDENQPAVCWNIRLQDRTIGWAATTTYRRVDGMTELNNRVYLGDFMSLDELVPAWLAAVLRPMFNGQQPLDVDKKTRLVLDPLGQPISFESRVCVAGLPDVIRIQGDIDGARLRLTVQSGDLITKEDTTLPPGALMFDEFSPHARMPRLYVGQQWTVPVYNPLRPSHNPMEILQATVERGQPFNWDGEVANCHLIVYRNDSGTAINGEAPRGRVWVREDGLVLREELMIWQKRLVFLRLPATSVFAIEEELGADLQRDLTTPRAELLLHQVESAIP